jgi:hypothetical protein
VELVNAIIIVGLPIVPVFWWKGWKHRKKNIQRVTGQLGLNALYGALRV